MFYPANSPFTSRRLLAVALLAMSGWCFSHGLSLLNAQQMPVPVSGGASLPSTLPTSPQPAANTAMPTIPSIESPVAKAANTGERSLPKPLGKIDLPTNDGQQWVEYDIRPYTQNLKNAARPQQAILDWILRETGTDVWFNEPMGVLTADRNALRVYHNPAMQTKVAQIYERFVNGLADPQVYSIRLITVGNPNWRNKATSLMRSASVQTPGVQAWLMPKENNAIFMAQLRERLDVRELQAADIAMINGQSQPLEQLRSRNFLREYKANPTGAWPPYTPVNDEIREGYKIQLSPLLSLDNRSVDLMLKCEIDQVERLNNVSIDLLNPLGPSQTVQIDVPQVVSWRLHERFRWPSEQVLLLSCGVVAAPSGQVNNTLLSGSPPTLFGLNKILPTPTGSRTDALLLIEYKGPASTQLTSPSSVPMVGAGAAQSANTSNSTNLSRGRY